MTIMRLYNGNNHVNENTDVYRFSDMMKEFFGNDTIVNKGYTVPKVNVSEEKDSYVLSLAVPGLKKSDISLNLDKDILSISHRSETMDEDVCYSCREFNYNNFERSFRIPDTVNTDKIKANYEDGILHIRLTKKEDAIDKGPREIKIL